MLLEKERHSDEKVLFKIYRQNKVNDTYGFNRKLSKYYK